MDDFVAHTSRWRAALIVATSLGFVAIGIWMAGLVGPVPVTRRAGLLMTEIWGWFCILFFGMCAIGGAKLWWTNAERLHISRSGIRWAGWSNQTIPWEEISDVTEWRHKGTKSIILHLRDPSRFPVEGPAVLTGLSGRANRAITGGDVSITLLGTDRKFDEAILAIATFRADR
ncbi:STM3941 family protein [Novosphingobium profundi]|uniref:STM3941 family protein n=1 Tax=Novosphingobium profundi TaxID=1774954 RepID=UPI001CFC54D1|nr:STM3941 family protein [Novosphingobium profundi]